MPATTLMDLRNEYAKHALNSYDEFTKIRQKEIRRIGWKTFKGQNSYRAKALNKFNPRGKAYERAIKIEREAFIGRTVNRVMSEEYQKIVMYMSKAFYTSLKGENGNS